MPTDIRNPKTGRTYRVHSAAESKAIAARAFRHGLAGKKPPAPVDNHKAEKDA